MPSFNNQYFRVPGVSVRSDLSGLAAQSFSPGGIIAMLGVSRAGEPNTAIRFTDPTTASNYFKTGDLLNAMNLAWANGAQVIYAIRVGNPNQSVLTVQDSGSGDVITFTSKDYGSYTNNIQVKVESGTTSGKKVSVLYSVNGENTILDYIDNAANAQEIADYFNNNSPVQLVECTVISASGVPQNTVYTNLQGASGDEFEVPTIGEWTTALNLLNTEYVDIVHPAGSSDPLVHALVQSHVVTLSNQKMERIGVVGGALGENVGDISTPNTYAYRAYNMNSERMILVGPGTDGEAPTVTAAKVVGLLAGADVATPLTYRAITATDIEKKYSMTEKDTLVKFGITAVEQAPAGRRIIRGVTTKQDPSEYSEDPLKEISVQRIKDYVTVNVRDVMDVTYIGKKGVNGVESQMTATVGSLLSRLKELEIIQGYKNIVVTKDPLDAKVFNITYAIAPISPINWIFIIQNFVQSI